VGLDESLYDSISESISMNTAIAAIVIKPDIYGGLNQILSFSQLANDNDIMTIISSSFNSGLALNFMTELSAALSQDKSHAGLDTYRWLDKDTLKAPYCPSTGFVTRNTKHFESCSLNSDTVQPLEF